MREQKRAIEETKAVFPGLRARIEEAVARLEGLLVRSVFLVLGTLCERSHARRLNGGGKLMQRSCLQEARRESGEVGGAEEVARAKEALEKAGMRGMRSE